MHGLLRCNINAGVRARGVDVSLRCHNRNPRWETGLESANDIMCGGFWGFWKKSVSCVESCCPKKKGDFCLLAEALGRCRMRWEGRWKSQNRKNVYLSPYVEESLNSKVIKSFVPELRSRKCFLCFKILCSIYMLWTFYVRFTHSHIMAMVQFDYLLITLSKDLVSLVKLFTIDMFQSVLV